MADNDKATAASSSGTNRWSLHGMTAIVTGGTKGIGYAIVEELTGFGARVHTCCRTQTDLNKCLFEWQAKGFQITGSVCDVSSQDQREKLMSTVSSEFGGKLNILINNVGTNVPKPTPSFTKEDLSLIMGTNFESAYNMCQLAYPLLKASGAGSIVFISSISGVVTLNTESIYGATKGAMNHFAKYLACEWAKDNIRVNSVAPGVIRTPLAEPYNEICSEAIKSRTPMGRTGEPEEVSSLVGFLDNWTWKISHIPREKNMAADWIAKWSCDQPRGLQLLSRPPNELKPILRADSLGVSHPRIVISARVCCAFANDNENQGTLT
ncbi:Short-chain dehydrogenase/reductase SDR [Corchorus olitorius]|uniref:Short-chain dehydrogenase/reductase SDR n=1 Tax=Corchorus olitorius TaxID=93759 RepID=A0A1R3FVR4_9ROSI|nr:Short-chain dehydrogenase/reductase SDR [Corchorus olitorius]